MHPGRCAPRPPACWCLSDGAGCLTKDVRSPDAGAAMETAVHRDAPGRPTSQATIRHYPDLPPSLTAGRGRCEVLDLRAASTRYSITADAASAATTRRTATTRAPEYEHASDRGTSLAPGAQAHQASGLSSATAGIFWLGRAGRPRSGSAASASRQAQAGDLCARPSASRDGLRGAG